MKNNKTRAKGMRKWHFTSSSPSLMVLMIVSMIGAIGNGFALPLMTIFFGELIDSFGSNQADSDIVDVVSWVSLKFVYLVLGSLVAAFLRGLLDGHRRETSYANIVDQTIGSIRTVASFTGEKQTIINYKKFLDSVYKSGVFKGTAAGLGLGLVMLVIFYTYALAVWFGSKMIREKGYNGGEVLNVIVAVLTGSIRVLFCCSFTILWMLLRSPRLVNFWSVQRHLPEELFGERITAVIFEDDIVKFCCMKQIGQTCIVLYMSYLYLELKKKKWGKMYGLIDTNRFSYNVGKPQA